MPDEHVDAARELLDAVCRRDLPRLVELTDPEVEWNSFFVLGEEGYTGHDALRRYLSDIHEAFEDLRPLVDDVLEIGEVVIAVGQVHYRGRESGVETDSAAGWVFKFRHGRVIVFRAFSEPEHGGLIGGAVARPLVPRL